MRFMSEWILRWEWAMCTVPVPMLAAVSTVVCYWW